MPFYVITTGFDCVGTEETEVIEAKDQAEAAEIAWEIAGSRLNVIVDSRSFDTEEAAESCVDSGDFEGLG